MQIMYPGSIIKKTGKLPGRSIAVFAGIHGNEKVGVLALKKIIQEVEVVAGTVYFVFANPEAIAKNTRTLNENLNRLFKKGIRGNTVERKRARELMKLLDKCDALLDIHSYNSKKGNQFAISEKRGFKVLKKMNFPIIGVGFSKLGHGTDGYMEKQRKIGVCIECGTTNKYQQFLQLAEDSVYQFLFYFGCIREKVKYSQSEQKIIRVKRMIYKTSSKFRFAKDYEDFELLPVKQPYAVDGDKKFFAESNQCILFPRPKVKVGEEVCIIGEFGDNRQK